jgi:hypothetical protein
MLVVKSDVWRYEQEYRVICPTSVDATDIKDSLLILEDGFLDIGPNALEAVIIGCQMSDEAVSLIRRLIREHSPNVKMRQAVRAAHDYRLQLEDI